MDNNEAMEIYLNTEASNCISSVDIKYHDNSGVKVPLFYKIETNNYSNFGMNIDLCNIKVIPYLPNISTNKMEISVGFSLCSKNVKIYSIFLHKQLIPGMIFRKYNIFIYIVFSNVTIYIFNRYFVHI